VSLGGGSKCGILQPKMGHENKWKNGHFCKSNGMVQFSKNDHFSFIFDLIL